jgi:hypothetical protein
MNRCNHLIDSLLPHLLGELRGTDAAEFHGHLQRCAACRRRHRQIRRRIRPREEAVCPICEGLLATSESEIGGAAGLPVSVGQPVTKTTV